VFFLFDGAAVRNHKDPVREVEDETGIEVIGIGVGDGCTQVPITYRHHPTVEKTERLPRALGELLLDETTGDR
jgi:hypothetical protein